MTNEQVLQALQHLIGNRYVPAVKGYISQLTGRARVTGAEDISTREFDPDRIHVGTDEAGLISGFSFG